MPPRVSAFFAAAGSRPRFSIALASIWPADWPRTCRFPRLRGSRNCRLRISLSRSRPLWDCSSHMASTPTRRSGEGVALGSQFDIKRDRAFGRVFRSKRLRGGVQARDRLDARGVAARAAVMRGQARLVAIDEAGSALNGVGSTNGSALRPEKPIHEHLLAKVRSLCYRVRMDRSGESAREGEPRRSSGQM